MKVIFFLKFVNINYPIQKKETLVFLLLVAIFIFPTIKSKHFYFAFLYLYAFINTPLVVRFFSLFSIFLNIQINLKQLYCTEIEIACLDKHCSRWTLYPTQFAIIISINML